MNYFKIFIFVVVTLIFFSSNNSKAECPSGYTERTVAMTYFTYDPYPNGVPTSCSMTITYCYHCPMTGMGFDLFVKNIHTNNGCIINEDFWEQSDNAIANDMLSSGCIAPCSWEGWSQLDYTITYETCWKHVHQAGWPANEYDITVCSGGAICNHIYRICVAYGEGGAYITKEFVRAFLSGTIDCPLNGEPTEPPYGVDPVNDYWETECFVFPTGCE